jgi:hypothetical protein
VIGLTETGWLLEKVIANLRRFVIMSDEQALAIGLWVLYTWTVDASDCAPYLDVSSPARECGKTRLFEALELVVRTPRKCTGHTEATLFRMIESEHPTLLMDEIDTTFGKDPKLYAGIRGILDDGHRRGGKVPRMVGEGKKMKIVYFEVFGPKAFAGIGALPETIASRSIPIRLQRKSRDENVQRFRYSREMAASADLRSSLEEWATTAIPVLTNAEPELPDELSDRQWDLWEPLFAIADLTTYGDEGRAAAITLHKATFDDVSAGLLLYAHLRETFNGDDRMSTEAILKALIDRDDGPWAGWWEGDVIAGKTRGPASKMARLLRQFEPDVHPKQLWIAGENQQGYEAAWFEKVWSRYLPDSPLPPPEIPRTLEPRSDMASDQATRDLGSKRGGSGTRELVDSRCPECGSASSAPGDPGHANNCPRFYGKGER